ncbi:putative phosphatase regulatory subunit-domain-containing protein [Pholiota molesta]|nr:putative phosphatase regulatory subunit-domain-containing protein [Pholiota molesta]
MPYSTPTDASPVVFPAQGRPGHRRSYSHITPPAYPPPTASSSSSSPSVHTLPRRKTTTSAPSSFPGPAADTPQKKPPTFQLGRDDDDDDSSDETPPRVLARHDDEDGRTLPPLRLRVKPSSFDAAVRRGSPPPRIALHPPQAAVPFPRSSPLHSPLHSPSATQAPPLPSTRTATTTTATDDTHPPPAPPARPSVTRTSSSPILLSNGKPLKSSLKGSSSAPHIPFPPQSRVPSLLFPHLHQGHGRGRGHQRVRSAPSTPLLDFPASSSPSLSQEQGQEDEQQEEEEEHEPMPPHKNVHFPSQEEGGLATVRVFSRSARPAALSRLGEETETETEGEGSAREFGREWGGFGLGWGVKMNNVRSAAGYPFPRLPAQSGGGGGGGRGSPLGKEGEGMLEVDAAGSTPVPARGVQTGAGNVFLESVGFVREDGEKTPKRPLILAGTLLVRNVAYQKTVVVRYTLDEWATAHDVQARYVRSLGGLPARFTSIASTQTTTKTTTADKDKDRVCAPDDVDTPGADPEVPPGTAPAWDRFRFEIGLEDVRGLEGRTLWLVGRYAAGVAPGASPPVPGAEKYAEWWDNNEGKNYRVVFKRTAVYPASPRPTATAPPPKAYPAPPQISASVSLPTSMSDLERQLRLQQLHRPHQAAVAQSTLARLRKLNLRNYAAPAATPVSPAAAPPVFLPLDTGGKAPERALSMESASSTDSVDALSNSIDSLSTASSATSADSTPLQTPTQDDADAVYVHRGPAHDLDLDVLGPAGDMQGAAEEDTTTTDDAATPTWSGPRWGAVGQGAKHFAEAVGAGAEVFRLRLAGAGSTTPTLNTPTHALSTTPTASTPTHGPAPTAAAAPTRAAAMDIGSRARAGEPSEMGTSPPFSALAEMGLGVSSARAWPNTNSNDTATVADATTATAADVVAAPLPTLYWPWGSFGDVAVPQAPPEEKMDEEKAKSVEPPVPAQAKTHPYHAHANANANANAHPSAATAQLLPPHRRRAAHPHPTATLPGSASSSGSESALGKRAQHPRRGPAGSPFSPAVMERAAGFPFPFPGARPGSPRPGSPRPGGTSSASAGGGVRSPLRLSPVHSFADLGGATPTLPPAALPSSADGRASPPPLSPGGQDDAVYQAFVRQWCFAQAPGPTVGASVGGAGAPTPMAAGAGEGPRLVVG